MTWGRQPQAGSRESAWHSLGSQSGLDVDLPLAIISHPEVKLQPTTFME